MQHFGFILASYLSSAFILAALAFWMVVDHRVQKKALADLDARGIRRRSAGASSPSNDNSQKVG